MSDRVIVDVDDGVADVRLNRPAKRNALDSAMFVGIIEATEALKARADLRAVVLSGEGESFCAGLDFAGFAAMAGDDQAPDDDIDTSALSMGQRITHGAQQCAWAWHEIAVPVIAALHGHALGGGLQISLGADIRIAHPTTSLSMLEIRWGLVPDMCASTFLPPLVGPDVAKELYWTGRVLTGVEAAQMGLVTRLDDDPHGAALDLAREIATKNPQAIRRAKTLIDEASSPAEDFARERRLIGELIGSPNQTEAVRAFFDERDPVFET